MSGAALDAEDMGLSKYTECRPPATHINKHTRSASRTVDDARKSQNTGGHLGGRGRSAKDQGRLLRGRARGQGQEDKKLTRQ